MEERREGSDGGGLGERKERGRDGKSSNVGAERE